MIHLTRLIRGATSTHDHLRYAPTAKQAPVVAWNCTPFCPLKCAHCYAENDAPKEQFDTAACKVLLDDLAAFGCPVVLFSGGEPLTRPDLAELIAHAREKGLRAAISTSGYGLDAQRAQELAAAGLRYAGISLDGTRETHDRFRGQAGAYDAALGAVRLLLAEGVKAGLRFTLTRENLADLPTIIDLLKSESIPRICVYHLAYTGRGTDWQRLDLSAAQRREAVGYLIDRVIDWPGEHVPEILTVDNHCDGPYLQMRLQAMGHDSAAETLRLLKRNGGNQSGRRIASIGWDGAVYPDPFWRNQPIGNVRTRPFSAIWTDPSQPLLAKLHARPETLPETCRICAWVDLCNGNLRARADAVGDPWGMDPACYLTEEERSTGPAG